MLLINRLSLSKLLAVFTVLAVFLSFQNIAFALTTGQVYPSLGTTVSEPPWSDNTWDTPANIYTDDGTNAEVTAPSYDNGDQTFVLKATGFDFSTIPDGSTINGITARINSYYSAGSGSIDLCQLFNVSRAKVGTNQCSTVVPLTTNTATIITKGSASDTWGNALTSAWVKDSDFGIAIGILATSNNTDVHVDYVTLEIDYTLSNTAPTLSISEPNGSGDTVTVGDSYNITYSLSDAEQTVTADFYYDTNNSGLDGTLITGCQNQTEGVGATCSWNTTGVTPGSYYVYGRDVTDGIAPEVSAYSSGTITINAPPASGTVSASPDTCTILSGASTCTVPFTWSISNATSPKLYNATRFIEYSTSASGSGVSFAITNGSNTVQVRDSTAVLNSTTATGSCTDGTSWNGSSCAVVVTYYDIVASSGANGSVTPTGTTTAYSIAPISGYEVATLLIDGGAITATTTYTFSNVTANHTISATFSLLPVTHTITSSAGSNGSITPLGAIVVADGASQAFSIIPESGFYTATLLVDGGTVSTSSPYTFTNVTADHTIEATFIALPGTEPAPVATVRRLASVTFQGRAFPDGKISIVRKELGNEIVTKERGGADANGFFNIRFTDLQTGAHSFGLLIKDPDGRTSQTKFFVVDVSRGDEIFKDIIAPPTVDILNGQVSRGGNLKVFGYASPGHTIRVYFDDILVKEALAGRGGVYSFDVPTGALDFGQHKVRAKQINLDGGRESDYSTERTFVVSKLTVVKADFSGDGKVDITDWSIFLARWGSKSSLGRAGIDLNSDGKIDITDFSIFIKTIRKK